MKKAAKTCSTRPRNYFACEWNNLFFAAFFQYALTILIGEEAGLSFLFADMPAIVFLNKSLIHSNPPLTTFTRLLDTTPFRGSNLSPLADNNISRAGAHSQA